jgi:hypothetical protein
MVEAIMLNICKNFCTNEYYLIQLIIRAIRVILNLMTQIIIFIQQF